MQSNDASAFLTTELTDDSASEHPAGQIALGAAGGLGLRSRILSAVDGNTGYTLDLPFTTMTSPF
ncbi:hypothetical protein ACIQM0_03155 [Streptomyces sp. NPDC091387]|uniref:hypothetical protein n=1 Tax=Streptomyces sp. NPDC091387 TaxID=3365998 RepID=UPI003814B327